VPYDHAHRVARWEVLKAADFVCYWCGGFATEADHVVPASLGGINHVGNYVAACTHCNKSRGARLGKQLQRTRNLRPSRRW
jgi:5-methylcytosine-specific restriction endonuclease McrA